MKLYNTLTRQLEDFRPLDNKKVRIYSCGPTVYDQAHIGNLSSFIFADLLKQVLVESGYKVQHVMNFTDVDDKTIRRSQELYPDIKPMEALKKLTRQQEEQFKTDMNAIGNDLESIEFIRATDSIKEMQELITKLHDDGFAYVADDGVYFSIAEYQKAGRTYGQLSTITADSSSQSRINNDEYDKDSAHDFALWKKAKDSEPSWEFELDDHDLAGRPGWHIECSAMSAMKLGQPFDIHTGGIDLIFPHHENEIAQSTALPDDPLYAKYFVHSAHLYVEGRKMSKSLGNFHTLADIQEKGFEPNVFRLVVLQSHYRTQANFTWDILEAAQNRLKHWGAAVDLKWQVVSPKNDDNKAHGVLRADTFQEKLLATLHDDLNTPEALALIDKVLAEASNNSLCSACLDSIVTTIKNVLGIDLLSGRSDISSEQKKLLVERQTARDNKDWKKSDEVRDMLQGQGIAVRDTDLGQVWSRI